MKRILKISRRLKQYILATLISVTVVLPVKTHADDTEVFLGVTHDNPAESQPNVLFIVDTSGSMGWEVGGGDKTVRMVALKQAMREVLTTVEDINIGLMSFNNRGGPVRLPVRDIDLSLSNDEGFNVVRNITQSSDDAQEIDESGAENGLMDLDNNLIFMSQGPALSATTTTLNIPMKVDTDEIDEVIASSFQYATDDNFYITPTFITGLRFQDVNLPQGADVVNATIRMTAYSDSPPTNDLTITGENVDHSTSMLAPESVESRFQANPTVATQDWSFAGIAQDQQINTANLEHIVDEIVGRPGWVSGNALSFFLNSSNGAFYGYAPHASNSASEEPELQIEYISSTGSGGAKQRLTGLRFQDVRIPQGAKITEAYISVKSSSNSTTPVDMHITGELSDDAATYTDSKDNISNRASTATSVTWNLTAADEWVDGERYLTPDISNVVQEIVDQNDWCGGNAMALELHDLTSVDARRFYSFDGAFDQIDDVPTLHVKYDVKGISPTETGCTLRTVSRQIRISTDDVEEQKNGVVDTTSSDIDIGARYVGLRFNPVEITQGAEILSAYLEFTSRNGDTDSVTTTIYGEDIDVSPEYASGPKDQISDRINNRATSNTVSWSISNTTTDQRYQTPDLTAIVKEIVDRPGWASGGSMGFMLNIASNNLEFYSFNGDALYAPRLVIEARINLTSSSVDLNTVRGQLLNEVNALVPNGGTPATDTFYEGIQYYRGDLVDWGTTRGTGSGTRWGRVSHPDSYENASGVQRDSACNENNLHADVCSSEKINGPANYISPISSSCRDNYIIMLTDGSPNTFYGQTRINKILPDGVSCSGDQDCAVKLAEFASNEDMSTGDTVGSQNLAGVQNVKTYTIGFTGGSDPDYLTKIADAGQGQYIQANSVSALKKAIEDTVSNILNIPSTFTAPTLTINAFNQIYNTGDVYLSLFEPSLTSRWVGNIKKYKLCPGATDEAPDFICDANDVKITEYVAGTGDVIRDNVESFWGGFADGPEVMVGGAGTQLQQPDDRRLFTYTDSSSPTNADLGLDKHKLAKSNSALTSTLFSVGDDATRDSLIDWIRGVNTEGENLGNLTTPPNERWAYADALHSAAVAITYGGTATSQIDKLLVGTNDGLIRMINAYNGKEEWAFMPQQMLELQSQLRVNAQADRIYGIDGSPEVWRKDHDIDGVINPSAGDFLKAFIGMRRGGNNYYGLDITPTSKLTTQDNINGITPKLMWRINGGTGDFDRLGQTWSKPKIAKIKMKVSGAIVEKEVLIFAGGYDSAYDTGMLASNTGNAIYIVDPDTGDRIWWASNSGSGAALEIPGMDYAIPSDLKIVDAVGRDGISDRIYVGDLGGNVWRIDLHETLQNDSSGGAVAHKLASLGYASEPATPNAYRRFMDAPQVALLLDEETAGGDSFIAVAINSGNRADPKGTTVYDRAYMIRDRQILPMEDTNSDGIADGLTTFTHNELYDAYLDVYQTSDATALNNADGWYIDFRDGALYQGEKAVSEGLLYKADDTDLDVEIGVGYLFSTWTPPQLTSGLANSCGASVGKVRIYNISLLNALQASDPEENVPHDSGGTPPGLSPDDPDHPRYEEKDGVPAPKPVPVQTAGGACAGDSVTAIIGTGGSIKISSAECYYPTYWMKN